MNLFQYPILLETIDSNICELIYDNDCYHFERVDGTDKDIFRVAFL